MYARSCPEIHWVPVVDEAGRRRLEMRWQVSAPATVSALPARTGTATRAA